MTATPNLIVGTRGSRLALVQTELVSQALIALQPSLGLQTTVITTKGDQNFSPIPLDTVGKTWFTTELEEALRRGEIDFAVHSLKDLPPEISPELTVLPVLVRADPRDVLVTKTAANLMQLSEHAIVGTDSLRRKAALLRRRPDLDIRSLRGNVETRLRKFHDAPYDAIVLAAAGLERLGRLDVVTEYLDPHEFIPAIGQGVLAAQARTSDKKCQDMLARLQDSKTLAAVTAEQAFARVIGGGCKLPVSCYVRFDGENVIVSGMAGSSDARTCVVRTVTGAAHLATSLAEDLARELSAKPFMKL